MIMIMQFLTYFFQCLFSSWLPMGGGGCIRNITGIFIYKSLMYTMSSVKYYLSVICFLEIVKVTESDLQLVDVEIVSISIIQKLQLIL